MIIPAGTLATMRCPACDSDDTKVIDSRPADDGAAIRRRRACPECEFRFTTFERYLLRVEPLELCVIKRDGSREVFERFKIVNGVTAAAKGRPVTTGDIESLTSDIEEMIRAEGGAMSTEQVGQAVLTRLRLLDQVAYLRFASVYKGFDEVDDFLRELALLDGDR
jgi:transcriptional repressor NrdR